MMKDAEAHAEEDRVRREEAEVRNNADSLVFQTEKLLKEQADKVEPDDKEKIEPRSKELKDALAGTDIDGGQARAREPGDRAARTSRSGSTSGAAAGRRTRPTPVRERAPARPAPTTTRSPTPRSSTTSPASSSRRESTCRLRTPNDDGEVAEASADVAEAEAAVEADLIGARAAAGRARRAARHARGGSRPTSRTTASACCASRPRWSSAPPSVSSRSCSRCSTPSTVRSARSLGRLARDEKVRNGVDRHPHAARDACSRRRASSASRPTGRSTPNEHEAVHAGRRRRRAAPSSRPCAPGYR